MASLEQFTECPTCTKPVATRQTQCPFCQKSFGRADVTRRHARSCRARGVRALPPQAKRGRKLRACDNCSKVKLSCDAGLPCTRCSSRHISCTYSAFCHDTSHHSLVKTANEPPKDGRLKLSYLLQVTDPIHTSLDVIVATEPERTLEVPAWKHRESEMTGCVSGTVDPRFLLLNFSDMLLDEPQDYQEMSQDSLQFSSSFSTPVTSVDTLTARVASLSVILGGLTTNKPHLKEGFEETCQRGFFTTTHFQKALIFSFRWRHYHKAAIHWPTFGPDKITLHLLLAVVLTGTEYLQHLDRSSQSFLSAPLLELCEKYIFKELKRLSDLNITPVTSRHMLELCQAAVLMNSLEGGLNHIEGRRRVASKRIPSLVALLRKFEMTSLEHPRQFDNTWEDFIHRETCIRVTKWTLINDSLMALLCNHPPGMTAREMTGNLPCSSDLWEAESSAIFEERAQTRTTKSYLSSCDEIVSGLLAEEWTTLLENYFKGLDTSDLSYAITGLMRHVFHCRTSVVSPDYSKMLLRALDRLDLLWVDAFERVPSEERRWLGIIRHTPEIVALSRRIIELGGTEEAKNSTYMQGVANYDTAVFHEFVQKYGHEGHVATGNGSQG
ncbi:hypothetical protein FHETE_9619 [Fusarium heterosporum]|uniref:Zn(2)-C6 fungal-type domain-containing protein n=1 Tax=Fusarium heterosporum TaxID=42747 RepID=A0A8H5SU06_FUSHE|nr:hypothetical protein FHETE_9619 [Fusarium heterosporum]